jgi:hypothetical protein
MKISVHPYQKLLSRLEERSGIVGELVTFFTPPPAANKKSFRFWQRVSSSSTCDNCEINLSKLLSILSVEIYGQRKLPEEPREVIESIIKLLKTDFSNFLQTANIEELNAAFQYGLVSFDDIQKIKIGECALSAIQDLKRFSESASEMQPHKKTILNIFLIQAINAQDYNRALTIINHIEKKLNAEEYQEIATQALFAVSYSMDGGFKQDEDEEDKIKNLKQVSNRLLHLGADVNKKNIDGETALDLSIRIGNQLCDGYYELALAIIGQKNSKLTAETANQALSVLLCQKQPNPLKSLQILLLKDLLDKGAKISFDCQDAFFKSIQTCNPELALAIESLPKIPVIAADNYLKVLAELAKRTKPDESQIFRLG